MRKKLIEVMPNLITNGAFFRFIDLFESEQIVPLGMAYGLMHSGDKPIAPFLEKILGTNETTNETIERQIAGILESIYSDKWTRTLSALSAEYDPLENYSMTESGTDTDTGTDNHSFVHGAQRQTNTLGAGHSDTTTKNKSVGSTELGVREKVETDVNQKVDTLDNLAYTDSDNNTKNLSKGHSLTRSGNIGTTTSQMMLQSEIDIRQYIFFEEIFKDIDKYLCLFVYE